MSFFPVNQAELVAYRNPVECKERARAVGVILAARLPIRYCDFRDLAIIRLFSPLRNPCVSRSDARASRGEAPAAEVTYHE